MPLARNKQNHNILLRMNRFAKEKWNMKWSLAAMEGMGQRDSTK
jgi:hypothetical protein